MALDLEKIPAATRKELIEVGRRFGSEDTLAQAEQTLGALGKYGSKLVLWGFNEADVKRLEGARDGLMAAGVGREAARVGKKATNKAYADAVREGKAKRLRARAVLSGARRALADHGDTDAVRDVDAELSHASTAGANASALAGQLDALHKALTAPAVAKAAKQRGGPEVVAALVTCAAALRAVSQDAATVPGTPEETERLDLLDGIIVGLSRDARKAARAAAKDSAEPAMAAAFELTKLYGSSKAKKGDAKAPELAEPKAPPPAAPPPPPPAPEAPTPPAEKPEGGGG
jgi:hypothetical protein